MTTPEPTSPVALADAAIALQRHIDLAVANRSAGSWPSIEDAMCQLERDGWTCVIATAPGGFAFNAAHATRQTVKTVSTSITEAARQAYYRAIRESDDAPA